ncbi:MAG: glucuronate isomerase [Enterobacter hormaechei]
MIGNAMLSLSRRKRCQLIITVTDAKDIFENKNLDNITEPLAGDHYKWRAMRQQY